jgi:hypothetical protein
MMRRAHHCFMPSPPRYHGFNRTHFDQLSSALHRSAMSIEPRASPRRTPEECNQATGIHFTPNGASTERRFSTYEH